MKKYGAMTLIVGTLALAASLGRAAWPEKAQDRVAAIARQNGFAGAEGLAAGSVSTPEGVRVAAGEPAVAITSFIMAGSRTRAAEICGRVTGGEAEFTVVRIVVDPKSDKPGAYNTLAGRDGAFCAAVVTYTGTATASAKVLGKESASGVASASEGDMR